MHCGEGRLDCLSGLLDVLLHLLHHHFCLIGSFGPCEHKECGHGAPPTPLPPQSPSPLRAPTARMAVQMSRSRMETFMAGERAEHVVWGQLWHSAPSPAPLVSVPFPGAPHSPGRAVLCLCSVGAAPSSHFIPSPTAACAKVSGGAAAGRRPIPGALSPLPGLLWMGSSSPPAGVEKSPGAKAGGRACVRAHVCGVRVAVGTGVGPAWAHAAQG